MKGMISIAAGLAAGIAGVAVGTAVAIAVNKGESRCCRPRSKMGRWTTMAMDAMGEAFHNVADLMK